MPKTVEKVQFPSSLPQRKRVAAYARVSSGKDAMLHSMSAQVSYYSSLIQNNKEWQYLGVYADEAKTGTKDSRCDFQRLIDDCRLGKIDMVITKSISRFARNTVTLLETVRELKAIGVDIYFEEQNIHTTSADGELMLTILASYAQEESRSASENQKWRIRKAFEKGEIVNLRHLYGYIISKEKIEIDEETAPIVKEIFARVISGDTLGSISKDLNERGLRCSLGGMWRAYRISEIISNEKYIGNSLFQKQFRNNHLEKKLCKNTGELPMFYAEETHPAIIDEETFKAAQEVLKKIHNNTKNRKTPKSTEFTGLIYCLHCGKNYRHVTTNGSLGWNCSTYVTQGKKACHGKKIPENTLQNVCAEVMGLDNYDPVVLKDKIQRIEVPEDNKLRFIFKDGKTVEQTWKDRSRSESWTPEMRQAAADKARRKR